MSDLAGILVIIGLMLFLISLSAAEAALSSISRSRAAGLAEDELSGAHALVEQLADRSSLLAPVLFVALGAQLSMAAILAVLVERHWGTSWIPIAITLQLVVTFVVAEAAPKVWAVRNIDQAALVSGRVAGLLGRIAPLRWLTSALGGLARLLLGRSGERTSAPVASEEEILALADAAVAADVLDDREGEFIQAIVNFGDTIVREAMVARPDVLAASADTTIDEAISMLVERGVSRMPIYGDDIDDVQGIVHIKDLFARVQRGRGNHFVSIAQRPPYFVPETKAAPELMAELKVLPDSMVVVVDEYGGTAGIVTMEDLIEEIVGEIVDEFDAAEEPLLQPLRRGEWRVHGRMPVDEFNNLLGADLPDDDWDTVGGLIFGRLGRVPEQGETVVEAGFQLTVEQLEGRRITRVRVAAFTADELKDEAAV